MSNEPWRGQHRYFLTLNAVFHHQPKYKDTYYVGDVLEKRGIELALNAAAYNPENPGQYDPDYHRRLVQARLNDFQLIGIDSDIVAGIADRDIILGSGFKTIEERLFQIIQEVPFKWREPLSEEPPAFGTELFNRYAKHPMVLLAILESMNREEYEHVFRRDLELQEYEKDPSYRSLREFISVARQVFETWFIHNRLQTPDTSAIEADYDVYEAETPEMVDEQVQKEDVRIERTSHPQGNKRPRYVFRHVDLRWQIGYRDGSLFRIKDLDGMFYLWLLVMNQGHWLGNKKIHSLAKKRGSLAAFSTQSEVKQYEDPSQYEESDPEDNSLDWGDMMQDLRKPEEFEFIDKRTRKQLSERLEDLDMEIQDTNEVGDLEQVEHLTNEREKIQEYLNKSTYRNLDLGITMDHNNIYRKVYRAIKRAIARIGEDDNKLAEHLTANIKCKVGQTSYGLKLDDEKIWSF